ncbi:MAG: hypothetical protein PVG65_00275 [Candidatus Thorarchaeota archaeon]
MIKIEKKPVQQKWVMVGIGGGGGKVAADFILHSRYMRYVVSSVHFLNTAGEDLANLRQTRLEKAFQNEWIWDVREKNIKKTGIPVDFIKFAFFGTGNNFVKSRELFEKYILDSQEFHSREEHAMPEEYPVEELEPEPRAAEQEYIKGEGEYDLGLLQSFSDSEESDLDSQEPSEQTPIEAGGLRNLYSDLIGVQNAILVHSLGGGTGGGSAPLMARWIKENAGYEDRKPTVISVCFLASIMDGPLRMANSLHNLMKISKEADIVLLFSNEILLKSSSDGKTEEERYLHMNERIIKAVDVLLSPTAVSELGGCVSVEFDLNNLKTYLRMILDDGGSSFPLNIAIPFVSIEGEKNVAAPVAFNYALGAEQVPIFKGSLLSMVPFFLSSSREVCREEFHNENFELYTKQIEVKGLQDSYDLPLESITGVADFEFRKDSKGIDVLALGLAKLNLDEYEDVLRSPRVMVKWGEFLQKEQVTSDRLTQRVKEWIDTYNQKIDEFNKSMAEYNRREAK